MSKSKIEWTDETWNPVTGCTKVSAGCKNCYAEREWPRLTKLVPSYAGRDFGDVRCHASRLDQPLRWKKPRRVFVNSMSDLFHESVPDEFIDQVFAVMALAKQHVFQVLTKRTGRMRAYITRLGRSAKLLDDAARTVGYTFEFQGKYLVSWPIPNIQLGVSIEDQPSADERVIELLETPAAVRWVSAEPLLGAVNLRSIEHPNYSIPADALGGIDSRGSGGLTRDIERGTTLDWVVVGGESGPKARPMHPAWVRSLRDQCESAGVPFLFKQWGEWAPPTKLDDLRGLGDMMRAGKAIHIYGNGREHDGHFRKGDDHMLCVGKRASGRLLDGVQHDGYPKGEKA